VSLCRPFSPDPKGDHRTVLTYIDVSAASFGVSESYSFYLVAIANATSGLGRFLAGALADRIGRVFIASA
jgi:MFS family permease